MYLVLPFMSVKKPLLFLPVRADLREKNQLNKPDYVNARCETNFLLKPQMLYCLTIMH